MKNESARIERMLASVSPYIATWAILDTGSTDDTPAKIRDFFGARGIIGYLDFEAFKDFSSTRNAALGMARLMACDYIMLVDADMDLVMEETFPFDRSRPALDAPAYQMMQRNGTLTYWNTRLLRRDVAAHYEGVTHEYLSLHDGIQPEKLHGAWFRDHADGANRPGKSQRDIDLLEADLHKHPDNARSWYYLAQSYRDIGRMGDASEAYKKRANLGGWAEEVAHARLMAARCTRDLFPGDPVFVPMAIDAFNERPWRAEPLHDLARYYREKGQNEAAVLFAERGLRIPKPTDDVLFIEDFPYDWGFREEISIAGFYTAIKERADRICEELALSRGAPAATREMAWQNLFYYTRPLAEQAPSFRAQQIDFPPLEGYRPCNPSVCQIGGRMFLNVRAVNYLIGQDGRYVMPEHEPEIRTRNFLFDLHNDLSWSLVGEISLPHDLPADGWNGVLGFEDLRLFDHAGELWCNATTRQISPDGWGEIVTARVGADNILTDWRLMHPEGPKRHEKNWMPICGSEHREQVYSSDPTRIVGAYGHTTRETTPPIAATEWGGSTQVIPFQIEDQTFPYGILLKPKEYLDGYLCLVHERKADPDPMHGQRRYQQRFVWFDAEFNIRRISRRFEFGDGEGEFPCGMCWHPDGERLVISYGVLDREAWLATVDANEVRAMLREVGTSSMDVLQGTAQPNDESPRQRTGLWLDRNTNAVLQTDAQIEEAITEIKKRGWPVHADRTKNWDALISIGHTLRHVAPNDPILDAGADRVSTYMPTLAQLGYNNLIGINLAEVGFKGEIVSGIRYSFGNIEGTIFPDNHFTFIACLSTIEHGVDVERFLKEAARILRPGGHLFISTDYWWDAIETHIPGWCIFTPLEITNIRAQARLNGLWLTPDHADLTCGNRVCHHAGLEYTFVNLLFRKAA